MKTYFRNSDGQFCSASQFFATEKNWAINTDDNFPSAEKMLADITARYREHRTNIALLIIGAKKVMISGCGSPDYVGIYYNKYGDVTVQSHVLAHSAHANNTANRADLLAAVFAEIERVLAVQQTYADRASAAFVDIP